MVMVEENSVAAPSVDLDFSFVKIPLEELRRIFRHSQRLLEQKLAPMTKATIEPEAVISTATELLNTISKVDRDDALIYRDRCAKRLKLFHHQSHLWEELRVSRTISEYLCLSGLINTAKLAGEHLSADGLDDVDVYQQLMAIEAKLRDHSTSECLLWCFENRAHLKKSVSPLEFYLRRQTYTELVRKRDLVAAITYAKKFFPPWADQFRREIEQSMALLAIGPHTLTEPYRSLYHEQRWQALSGLFRKEFLELHSIQLTPTLVSNLRAGLSALKTAVCSSDGECNVNCPVCVPPYADLSRNLPFSHHENSSLVCKISGQVMNEHNPPLALPNGRVYSQKALQDMAAKNQGKVVCPRTGQMYQLSDARKVFIL